MPSKLVRASLVLLMGCMLPLAGSCGTGSGQDEAGGIAALGGIIRPHPQFYGLTQASDPAFAVGGCAVEGGMLPTSVDLRRDGVIPPVQNQRWNSCVAWAFGYYCMTALEARRLLGMAPDDAGAPAAGPTAVDVTDPANWFSPDFVYSQRDLRQDDRQLVAGTIPQCMETDGELGCMRPERALRILMEQGCCKWTWMCRNPTVDAFRSCAPDDFDTSHLKSRRAYAPSMAGAEEFRPRCYVRFGVLDDQVRFPIKDMQGWLHEQGTPIAIVVKMMNGWLSYRGENPANVVTRREFACDTVETRAVCLDAGGEDLGSQHMMTVIGYDDNYPNTTLYRGMPEEKTGSFLVINQWGEKWGHRGLMWIPYSELRKIWIAGYGVTGITDTANTPGGQCQQRGFDPQTPGSAARHGEWFGISEDGNDVPTNLVAGQIVTTATELVAPAALVGVSLGVLVGDPPIRDNADWYVVKTTKPNTWIDLRLTNLTVDVDVKLTDLSQQRIGGSTNRLLADERITRLLCDPGSYLIKVYPHLSTDSGTYDLDLTSPGPGTLPSNNDICGASTITLGGSGGGSAKPTEGGTRVQGEVGGEDDACDWWKVQIQEAGIVEVTLEAFGVSVEAWRGETPDTATLVGRSVRPKDDWLYPQLSVSVRPGDQLFLRVSPERVNDDDDVGIDDGSYLLFAFQVPDAASDDTPAGATPLVFQALPPGANDPSVPWEAVVDAELGENEIVDYYRIRAPAGTPVTLSLLAAEIDAELFLTAFVQPARTEQDINANDDPAGRDLDVTMPPKGELLLVVGSDRRFTSGYRLMARLAFNENPARDGARIENQRTLVTGQFQPELVGASDQDDWYRVDRSKVGTDQAVFLLTGFCGELDLRLFQEDFTGTPVHLPLVDAGSTRFRTLKRIKNPETLSDNQLWVRVAADEGSAATHYTLSMNDMGRPRGSEGGDTPSTAREIRLGEIHASAIGEDNAWDYYRISIAGPARIRIQLLERQTRTFIQVWNDSGTLYASNFGQNSFVDFDVPESGFLTIRIDTGSLILANAYRMQVTRVDTTD